MHTGILTYANTKKHEQTHIHTQLNAFICLWQAHSYEQGSKVDVESLYATAQATSPIAVASMVCKCVCVRVCVYACVHVRAGTCFRVCICTRCQFMILHGTIRPKKITPTKSIKNWNSNLEYLGTRILSILEFEFFRFRYRKICLFVGVDLICHIL